MMLSWLFLMAFCAQDVVAWAPHTTSINCTLPRRGLHMRGHCVFSNLVWYRQQLYMVVDEKMDTAQNKTLHNITTSEWTSQISASPGHYTLLGNYVNVVTRTHFLDKQSNDGHPHVVHHDLGLFVKPPSDILNWWHSMDDLSTWC